MATSIAKWMPKDESNPYFTYDPSKCIVCSRCVRACEEVQGTFALTIEGRGFGSRVSPGMHENFLESECVSCGACVQACPTATLTEKSVIEIGQPEHSVVTTCAYCGVGCSFKAEMRGEELVRMVPWKDGKANRGHSCVKGRFAYGYATHKERILNPMIREKITDPWREVSWEEAFAHTASEFRRIQYQYGRESIGGITSSRCTNEETYLVQKLIRAGFGNNNVDTCARVCHSPTGYGLGADLRHVGRHAGFRFGRTHRCRHRHRRQSDRWPSGLCLAPEEAAAPGRQADRDRSAPHRHGVLAAYQGIASPAAEARHQCRRHDGAGPCHRHRRSVLTKQFIRERCDWSEFEDWAAFVSRTATTARKRSKHFSGVPAEEIRGAARLFATGGNGAIYYGLGVTEHSQGSTTVIGDRQSRHGDRQYRSSGRRREPAAWPEQCPGRLRHGLLPA